MYQFAYHKPTSIEAAAALFADSDDPAYLSGGHTLIPTLKQRLASPSDLIDLSAIDALTGLSVAGGTVSIGAFTCHADVAGSAEVQAALPALSYLAEQIGDAQVRARGTIGGSVANSDPAADYPAAVVALNATVTTNRRQIAGDEFFTGLFETAMEEGEILTRIDFSVPTRAAYRKFPNPASRYAVVGVMVADYDGDVRVGVTGAGACAHRSSALEAALGASFTSAAAAGVQIPADELNNDLHASSEYRAHLVSVMAARAVDAILGA